MAFLVVVVGWFEQRLVVGRRPRGQWPLAQNLVQSFTRIGYERFGQILTVINHQQRQHTRGFILAIAPGAQQLLEEAHAFGPEFGKPLLEQFAFLLMIAARGMRGQAVPVARGCRGIQWVPGDLVIDSMEDIVWSINPARDRIEDLSRRMRQFAGEVLESQGIDFEMNGPDANHNIALDPGTRRHLYLIFKESIHNLRHSGCSKCAAAVRVTDGELQMEIRDDGRGLRSGTSGEGQGLASMRARAARLAGRLEVHSTAESTVVTAGFPVRRTFQRR